MPNVSSERLEEKNNFFSSDFSRDSIARGCSQLLLLLPLLLLLLQVVLQASKTHP